MVQLSAALAHRAFGLALSLTLLTVACRDKAIQQTGSAALPVKLQQLQPGNFQETTEFVGALEAQDRVVLKPDTEGRIVEVFVAPGDAVTQGQPIVQLRPDQVQAQVQGAEAAVSTAQSAIGAAVAQKQAAASALTQAQANTTLARTEFNRTQSLAAAGALSKQDLDLAKNQLDVALAQEKQALDRLNAAQAQVGSANSQLAQAQAQANVNRESLNFKQVTAPIAGIVGDMPLKVGDYVPPGQTITTITQNASLNLRIQIPASRSAALRVGLPVELADLHTGKRLGMGSISFVAPEVDAAAQSILVQARFPNQGKTLREGQSVLARIIWNSTTALLVPTTAVSRIGSQSFVFVAQEKTTEDGQTMQVVSQRPVKLGSLQADSYQVIEGLQAGEKIAVSNILKLRDGLPIAPETATVEPQTVEASAKTAN